MTMTTSSRRLAAQAQAKTFLLTAIFYKVTFKTGDKQGVLAHDKWQRTSTRVTKHKRRD
jgi:hypothetical protein